MAVSLRTLVSAVLMTDHLVHSSQSYSYSPEASDVARTIRHLIIHILLYDILTLLFKFQFIGLPWWVSGKESACQYRRHQFNP